MKVLLINASPKKNGATQKIVDFMESALPQDVQAQSLCMGDVEFSLCVGCKSCYEAGDCFRKDGVQTLLRQMDECDAVVIVCPSWWADVPAQFKAFIDRCTPWCNTHEPHQTIPSGKRGYAIALRTGPGMKECERIISSIEHFYGHLEIECRGHLGLCSVENKEDAASRKEEISAFCTKI